MDPLEVVLGGPGRYHQLELKQCWSAALCLEYELSVNSSGSGACGRWSWVLAAEIYCRGAPPNWARDTSYSTLPTYLPRYLCPLPKAVVHRLRSLSKAEQKRRVIAWAMPGCRRLDSSHTTGIPPTTSTLSIHLQPPRKQPSRQQDVCTPCNNLNTEIIRTIIAVSVDAKADHRAHCTAGRCQTRRGKPPSGAPAPWGWGLWRA